MTTTIYDMDNQPHSLGDAIVAGLCGPGSNRVGFHRNPVTGVTVSTIHLQAAPLFETYVWVEGSLDTVDARVYKTFEAAVAGHEAMCVEHAASEEVDR